MLQGFAALAYGLVLANSGWSRYKRAGDRTSLLTKGAFGVLALGIAAHTFPLPAVALLITGGAIAGVAGTAVVTGLFGSDGVVILRTAAAALIFAIGLQLLFGRPLLTRLEQAGSRFWRVLSPQMHKLLPPRNPLRAFGVGTLWGWLPCGLVYSELAVATASGGPITGALVMAFFGMGTIVSLSAVSVLLHSLGMFEDGPELCPERLQLVRGEGDARQRRDLGDVNLNRHVAMLTGARSAPVPASHPPRRAGRLLAPWPFPNSSSTIRRARRCRPGWSDCSPGWPCSASGWR